MKHKAFRPLLFFLLIPLALHAQAKPPAAAQKKLSLAILPFTGHADGETIAALLGNQSAVREVWTVVPRTSAGNDAIFKEQQFQRSGLTDSETIAKLGKQMNADYAAAGHIQTLGDKKLVIINIVHVETFRQIAGAYTAYGSIEEVRGLLPGMAENLARLAMRDAGAQPKLAVLPFSVTRGVNEGAAETLAHILAACVANSGAYAVMPRTATIERVMREHSIQREGLTERESVKEIGRALNAEYVLAGNVMRLGSSNLFVVQILNVENGALVIGDDAEYEDIQDGLHLMEFLSYRLTGKHPGTPEDLARSGYFSLGKLPGGSEYAAELASQAIADKPGYADAYVVRALAYLDLADYDRAVADASQAVKLDPKNAQAYRARGNAHFKKGNTEAAVADYTRALAIDSGLIFAYVDRASAYAAQGGYDRAIADYTSAISLSSRAFWDSIGGYEYRYYDIAGLYYDRGRMLNYKEVWDGAIADYTQAIALNRDHGRAYWLRGRIYSGKGLYDEAAADFSQCLRLWPDYAPAYAARAYTWYKRIADSADYFFAALDDYDRAISLSPNNAKYYIERGDMYYSLADNDRAIADYTLALKTGGMDAFSTGQVYERRGDAYYMKQYYYAAVSDYTEAIRLYGPASDYTAYTVTAYYLRAKAYDALGKIKEAAEDRASAEKLRKNAK